MRVKINNTIYYVLERVKDEVCVLQTFDYGDGLKRQLKIWTNEWIKLDEKD